MLARSRLRQGIYWALASVAVFILCSGVSFSQTVRPIDQGTGSSKAWEAGRTEGTAGNAGEDTRASPEPDTGLAWARARPVRARKHMIVAANPYAAEAGLAILRRGGNALDAAIAAQMVLNLVEPQSSGIGGGLFLLYWDAHGHRLSYYDGRETAPRTAGPKRFLASDGEPYRFRRAVASGLSVGVPGVLRALEAAHRVHGRLAWADLFAPAIKLAEDGFLVSPRLNRLSRRVGPARFGPRARHYFFDSKGVPWPVGHRLRNPELASSLRAIAEHGAEIFYAGPLAHAIVAAIGSAPHLPGDLSLDDLARYKAKVRPPLCGAYRGLKVCGVGPPSSGGYTLLQALALLERFDLGRHPLTARALHLIAEAEKLAYADRKRYIADPDFVAVPQGLLDAGYLAGRARLIDGELSMGRARPGTPPHSPRYGVDNTDERPGTSHLSIIDSEGNAIALTSSIEQAFGSGVMVGGFLLNNELTDFAFRPRDAQARPVANRVEGGKRPRSSMAPTMVFDQDGRLIMVAGSPGGSRIIVYVLKALIGLIDWRLDAQAAVSLANFGDRKGALEVERGRFPARLMKRLRMMGHEVREVPMNSGLHIIVRRNGGLEGGVDPRREGRALGD